MSWRKSTLLEPTKAWYPIVLWLFLLGTVCWLKQWPDSYFVGILSWSLWSWERLWGASAKWHRCLCDHRVERGGEQLGNVLPWRVPQPSAGIRHLLGRPVQHFLDGRQVSRFVVPCFPFIHMLKSWFDTISSSIHVALMSVSTFRYRTGVLFQNG